jgi:uncharacterized LabA/DUF88 family protein
MTVVRFFPKRTTGKEAAAQRNGASTPAQRSASATRTAPATRVSPPAKSPPAEPAAKKTPRRRTTARPPKRDWAAEAAAAPPDAPAPKPSSLAATPSEDAGTTAAAAPKRRRGTRGGRGRKKPPAAPATEAAAEEAAPAAPQSLEALVARQVTLLEQFARETVATHKALQAAIDDLRGRVERASSGAAPRVGIFVDVPNLVYAAERRNVSIDFGRVLDYFTRDRELVRANAYAPISDDPQAKLEQQRFVQPFVGHPYRIVTKPLKRFADGSMKANFDIELAIDILTMSDRLDVVVLMSGDGDFRRLVELIASRGVRVEVVAFGETASAELRTVADRYIDIGAHIDEFKVQK